ncbi:MAG: hypothetical protein EOM47_06445 [Bacteroidia bacterium]|jgi:hypothetical protein|nr:hypothetical protein [Bacteroidia bacterium]
MENINNLLDKYFRAETSIAEEQQLKNYFSSTGVLPEHMQYKALFDTFSVESFQKMPVRNVKAKKKVSKPVLWWGSLSASGIAASLILGFWFLSVDASADYAYVNGHKVENRELVEELANEKLLHVNGVLNRALQPVDELQTVKENLQPLREIGAKMNSIRNNKNGN